MDVLIAEDEPISRHILETTLRHHGCQVTVCAHGKEALEQMAAPHAPRILILDWMMPEMDGLDVCRALRQRNDSIRPFIFMLSARATKEDLAQALDAGADDYITKPFNVVELLARLRVAERMVQAQQQAQQYTTELEEIVQRYHLLGELRTQRSLRPQSASIGNTCFDPYDIPQTLEQTFADLGVTLATEAITAPLRLERVSIWTGLLAQDGSHWADLVWSIPAASLVPIYQALTTKKVEIAMIPPFLSEVFSLVASGFKRIGQERKSPYFQPKLPQFRVFPSLLLTRTTQYTKLTLNKVPSYFGLYIQPTAPYPRPGDQLDDTFTLLQNITDSEGQTIPAGTVCSPAIVPRLPRTPVSVAAFSNLATPFLFE